MSTKQLRKTTFLNKSQVKAINNHIELFELDVEPLEERGEYLFNLTSNINATNLMKEFKDVNLIEFFDRCKE